MQPRKGHKPFRPHTYTLCGRIPHPTASGTPLPKPLPCPRPRPPGRAPCHDHAGGSACGRAPGNTPEPLRRKAQSPKNRTGAWPPPKKPEGHANPLGGEGAGLSFRRKRKLPGLRYTGTSTERQPASNCSRSATNCRRSTANLRRIVCMNHPLSLCYPPPPTNVCPWYRSRQDAQ